MFVEGELGDIIISVIFLALIFSYPTFSNFFLYLGVVIISFLFHELAHRYVARKFNCLSFYKMWPQGILIGMLLAFISGGKFLFAAPGAVMIYPYRFGRWKYKSPHLSSREMGIIAFAGPAVNLFFAIFFRIPIFEWGFFSYLSSINAWLALFNLLPIPPLDGSKIITWKPWFWIVLIVVAGLLFF
ncbi:MAG: site-2 protease family protein [Candidatus Omnitrophica bacterium]|nr:site-2 protease family protein [Candidatus Omnitrophota bacterium]